MKWTLLNKKKPTNIDQISKVLLTQRGIETQKQREEFFNSPDPFLVLPTIFQNQKRQLTKAKKLIKNAISNNIPIIIHGDYDVDGLCGTAIFFELFFDKLKYPLVRPFIPDRFEHGYGLSEKSIQACFRLIQDLDPNFSQTSLPLPLNKNKQAGLLITTDCGITSNEAIELAKKNNFKVIVTDHHSQSEKLPQADAILWTNKVCAAGLALSFGLEFGYNKKGLDLAALATVADLQSLLGINRSLVKFGLWELNKTKRVGLQALAKKAGLKMGNLGTYEVGWMIGPRLNASGRLENALDALRLLCTSDKRQAYELAEKLNAINRERQNILQNNLRLANGSNVQLLKDELPIIIVHHKSFHEGVIGLVAGKLTQQHCRPSVVISRGEKLSKGSARSVNSFNIIKAIRLFEDLLVDAGGHPMAAGFTIETDKIEIFKKKLSNHVSKLLTLSDLEAEIKIDMETNIGQINWELVRLLKQFEPFGIGNYEPVFLSKNAEIDNLRLVGNGKHLKMNLRNRIEAVGFGMGERVNELQAGNLIDIVYTVNEDDWGGRKKISLKLKDLRKSPVRQRFAAGDAGGQNHKTWKHKSNKNDQ